MNIDHQLTVTWDQARFNKALEECVRTSSRSEVRVINTHAYHVALAASALTEKASRAAIADTLGSRATGKAGRLRLSLGSRPGNEGAPLAALIIQARRAGKNQPGLYGKQMEEAVRKLLASRLKSIAFLRAGWIPAIRKLAPFADRRGSPGQGDARKFGRDAGDATPATESPSHNIIAEIVNSAASLSKTSERTGFAGFEKFGEEGLVKGLQQELASMEQHLREKMDEVAGEFNRAAA